MFCKHRLDWRPQLTDSSDVQKPRSIFRDIRSDLAARAVAKVPQLALEVDERHSGAMSCRSGAAYCWPEIIYQLADRLLGVEVTGPACTRRSQSAE